MVIYTAAGTHPIQTDYSHGSPFPCQNVYIHGCRSTSIKVLFTRQSFLIPKCLLTRLPCIKYKSAIYTAAVSHVRRFLSSIKVLFTRQSFLIPKCLLTRLLCIKYKSAIYTAAVSHVRRFLSSIKVLSTRQPFSTQNVLYTMLSCLQYEMDTCNYTAVVPNKKNTLA